MIDNKKIMPDALSGKFATAFGISILSLRAALLPMPEMTVPKTSHPPVIDGDLKPGEWDRAAACTGFVNTVNGGLAKIQSTAWITYDDQYIYVAFKNYRSEQLDFLSVKGRRPDDDRIVYDPSNEIWITPPGTPAVTYQSLINVYPAVLDAKMIPSLGYTSKSWSGKWEIASRQSSDAWTLEARAPISAFGLDRIADGATWRALFTTDILSDNDKFRAWAPGGAFADIARHGFLHFTAQLPAFQLIDVESISTGKPTLAMAVVGSPHTAATVTVTARFGSRAEPEARDVVLTRAVSVEPGARREFDLSADQSAALPRTGFCEITAKAGSGVLYHQIFPFTVDGFVRRPPARLRTTPYDQKFGLEASYAPLSKQLLVKIDRYFMQPRTAATGGRVQLIDPKTGKVIADRGIAPFREDYSEFPIDLTALPVPVETERDWASLNPGAALGLRRNPQGSDGAEHANYTLRALLTGKDGREIADASTPVRLMGYQFSWLPNNIGVSDLAIAPWRPVSWVDGAVSVWNKRYKIDNSGLAAAITNSGVPQLSGPMKLEAVIDGRTVVLNGAGQAPVHQTDAAVEFAGEAHAANLTVKTNTRVEFDGFVWNTMSVEPTRANLARLSLVVDMPDEEGPFFVTTSGSWNSYFGRTPEHWDSRESSLTNMVGNFVPYVFLTDSERGFAWFADNTKGWRLDPALPTQELRRHDGLVTLRVNFINKSGPVSAPMTIQYGWMVTPQKAQPKAWRGYLIAYRKYFPQATTLFLNDADWDVLWPYYSSPFPKDYRKSATMLSTAVANGVVPCVGNIAHAIARYSDYRGRNFNPVAADWGNIPGDLANGDVARSRGPNDFQLFHFDRWSKLSGLSCLYFDENYLAEDWNYLTGGAWLMPDDQVQPGYSYLGLREYNKRLRYMFHDNHKPLPSLWEHTTGGQAVYAWMPDVSMEGENVEPTDLDTDYLDALPASRLRSIDMGRNLGSAPFVMCQVCRHSKGEVSKTLAHQLVGWLLAHDALPEQVPFWPTLASELELWRDDIRFLPYWRKDLGISSLTAGIDVSAHVRPGNAVLWIVNENREDAQAAVRLDLAKIGLDPHRAVDAYDAENGQRYPFNDGLLSVPVPKRMWRAVRVFQPRELNDKVAFIADFDHEVAATEAYGGRYPLGDTLPQPVPGGRTGKGASLDQPIVFLARHHVSASSGTISFALRLKTPPRGTLVSLAGLDLSMSGDTVALTAFGKLLGRACYTGTGDPVWHDFTLRWIGDRVQVLNNGTTLIRAHLPAPLVLPGMGRGLDIRDVDPHIEPATITFGAIRGAIMDDLRMSHKAL